jgi:hypothetical protein
MAVSALGQAETMTADGAVCSERHAGSPAVPICSFAGIRTSSARGLVAKHKAWSSDIPRVGSWTAQAGTLGRALSAVARRCHPRLRRRT